MVDKTLKQLLVEYNKLDKEQQIIPLSEVNNMVNRIIDMTKLLKEELGDQLTELEELVEESDGQCGCDDESELYNLYSDIYDAIYEDNMYKALYLINSYGNITKSESCACEVEKPKVEEKCSFASNKSTNVKCVPKRIIKKK